MFFAFEITLFIWLAIALYSMVLKKRLIGLNLFTLVGIYLPMLLFTFSWSMYVDPSISDDFWLIFFYLNLFMIVYNLLVDDHVNFDRIPLPTTVNKGLVTILNWSFLILFLVESYIGSGSILPALEGIDIHTFSAPIIAFVTRNVYIFVLMNVVAWIVTKRRSYLVWAVVLIVFPIVTRSMRISAIIALVQVGTFFAAYYAYKKKSSKVRKVSNGNKPNKLVIGAIACFAAILVFQSAAMTDDRMGYYGKYDLSYAEEIGYSGPSFLEDVVAVYYGYFPMSFNNLNLSLKYGHTDQNYLGLYSFRSVYFGVLQFDNIFDLDLAQPDATSVKSSPSATVATAFWDFYYDYGYLCFIPIGTMALVCGLVTTRLNRKPTFFMAIQYYYFIPLVFFQSFQNVFFSSEMFYEIAIAAIVAHFVFAPSKRSRTLPKEFPE